MIKSTKEKEIMIEFMLNLLKKEIYKYPGFNVDVFINECRKSLKDEWVLLSEHEKMKRDLAETYEEGLKACEKDYNNILESLKKELKEGLSRQSQKYIDSVFQKYLYSSSQIDGVNRIARKVSHTMSREDETNNEGEGGDKNGRSI